MALPASVFQVGIVNVPGKIQPVVGGQPVLIPLVVVGICPVLIADQPLRCRVRATCTISKIERETVVLPLIDRQAHIQAVRTVIVSPIPVTTVDLLGKINARVYLIECSGIRVVDPTRQLTLFLGYHQLQAIRFATARQQLRLRIGLKQEICSRFIVQNMLRTPPVYLCR